MCKIAPEQIFFASNSVASTISEKADAWAFP